MDGRYEKCVDCGGPVIQLFTGVACKAECDLSSCAEGGNDPTGFGLPMRVWATMYTTDSNDVRIDVSCSTGTPTRRFKF